MTLGEMLSDVYEDTGHNSAPPTAVTTRITKNLNKAYRMILGDPALSGLRNTMREASFASESGVWHQALPEDLSRVNTITERDNDRRLEPVTLDYIRTIDPGMTATGSPWAFVNMGRKPSRFPVSDATSGLWAVSTAAGDTTQTVEINGVRASIGGTTGDITTTLTGTSRVQLGTFTDYCEIQTIRLSAVCTGTIAIYDAVTDGHILAAIPPGKLSQFYVIIRLYPTPSSAITYYVDGEVKLVNMDDTADIPLLPDEFHDMIPLYAKALEYEKMSDDRYSLAMERFDKRFRDLKYRMNVQHGQIMAVGSQGRRGISRMGGMFPVDTVL